MTTAPDSCQSLLPYFGLILNVLHPAEDEDASHPITPLWALCLNPTVVGDRRLIVWIDLHKKEKSSAISTGEGVLVDQRSSGRGLRPGLGAGLRPGLRSWFEELV